jgi:hypothetical protein
MKKAKLLFVLFGLAFSITLAVIVGQRLSSEAMAVVVGVVAGVAASIPTSLIVVWFATRSVAVSRPAPEPPPPQPAPAPAPEPRLVVMTQPQPMQMSAMPIYQSPGGYVQPGPYMAINARQFTVIGGADVALTEPEPAQEVVWPR